MLQLIWNSQTIPSTKTAPTSMLNTLEIDFLQAQPHIKAKFVTGIVDLRGKFDRHAAYEIVKEYVKAVQENVFDRYGGDMARGSWLESVLRYYSLMAGTSEMKVTETMCTEVINDFAKYLASYSDEEIATLISDINNRAGGVMKSGG